MTAAIPEAPGPLCDICAAYEAMGSLMQLANWETTRFCGECAPEFLRTVADAIGGPVAAAEVLAAAPDQPDQPEAPETQECAKCGQAVELADIPGHVEMHAAEGDYTPEEPAPVRSGKLPPDWPGTENRVRSTHGHRGKRGGAEADGE